MDVSSSSTVKFVHVTFTNSSTVRLDQHNFIVWRKQVLTTVRDHKLQAFLSGSSIKPEKFLTQEDKELDRVNSEYVDWEQQDQLLLSWLFSTLKEFFLE